MAMLWKFWPERRSAAPELLRSDGSAFRQRRQLCPSHLGVDDRPRCAGAKPAVGAGDDVLLADDTSKADDALAHELRMLDDVRRRIDDAGDDDLVLRQLRVPPYMPLVLVAAVRRHEGESLRPRLKDQIDDRRQGHVVVMR